MWVVGWRTAGKEWILQAGPIGLMWSGSSLEFGVEPVLHTRNSGLKCWVRSLYAWHPMTSETRLNTKEKKHTKRLGFIIQLLYLFSGNCSWAVPVTVSFQPVIQKLSSVLTCSSHLGCRYYQDVASKVYYEFHLSILKEYRMWKRWIYILKAVAREEYICIT